MPSIYLFLGELYLDYLARQYKYMEKLALLRIEDSKTSLAEVFSLGAGVGFEPTTFRL
jgi:uncharacterized protein (DUF2062 family)